MPATSCTEAGRELPRKLKTSHAVVHGRRIYPPGFVRVGGERLPAKQREEALREIEATTSGMDVAQSFVVVQRIVARKWNEVASQPSDIIHFSYGRSTAPTYQDPDAREQARRMLVWIPTSPEFKDILDAVEVTVWSMSFSGDAQETIATAIGKSHSVVSKVFKRIVEKLNARYRELRDRDELPIAIAAWVRQTADDDSRHTASDLADAIARLRKRDWILQARKRDVGPVAACNPSNAMTGDLELDGLSIRKG